MELTPDYNARFIGVERLFGSQGLQRLRSAHVLIIGLGGVGSWVAESLVRSGVGQLTLMDYDEICVSNSNRQVHTLSSTLGRLKVSVLSERLNAINPEVQIHQVASRFDETTAELVLNQPITAVVDAIDSLKFKCLLLAKCKVKNIYVVSVGSSGGRADPTQIRVDDLYKTGNDPLLQQTRKKLRRHFDFPNNRKKRMTVGIPCVYSIEPQVHPPGCETPTRGPLNCGAGFGSVSFVTGTMGLHAASLVVRSIIEQRN